MSVGRSRSRRSVGRPRRRSTTVRLQDKATVYGKEYPVYTNTATTRKERVVFGINDSRFLNAKMDTEFSAHYLNRSYSAKKSMRIVRRGNQKPSGVPVLEFEVTSGK